MTVLNVTLTKIHAERSKLGAESVKVNTNVGITSVEKAEISIGAAKQQVARFDFDFKVDYEPKVGEISIQGNVLYLGTKEKIESLVADWKKNKKNTQDAAVQVINRILNKCQIESLILSKELGIPSPVHLQKVHAAKE